MEYPPDLSPPQDDNTQSSASEPSKPLSLSAVRIVVRCISHKIPGPPKQRLKTMADIVCEHHWQRKLDKEVETIRVWGYPEIDGEKVRFLLDSGTLEGRNQTRRCAYSRIYLERT